MRLTAAQFSRHAGRANMRNYSVQKSAAPEMIANKINVINDICASPAMACQEATALPQRA